jgi:uncharacterized membrane protein SpoIIM required for sporulation
VTRPRDAPATLTGTDGTSSGAYRGGIDIDRFIATHEASWRRLDDLVARARRGIRRLEPGELEELLALYQRASAHLSHARGYYRDPPLTTRLTTLVAAANGVVYGKRARTLAGIRRFFAEALPASVWRTRRFVAASAALLLVPAIIVGAWMASSERALDVAIPESQQEALIASEFEDYYSSSPAGQFSTEVLLNNIRVAFTAFALGILVCLGTAFILVFNGINVGIAAGLFVDVGQAGKFFGLILPHGLLELTSVIIAGGAGLRLGWAIVAPGDRSRVRALTEAGRDSVTIVLGLMLAFVVAGIIEGFVTPSPLPTWARVGVGAAVEIAFLAYLATGSTAAAPPAREPA